MAVLLIYKYSSLLRCGITPAVIVNARLMPTIFRRRNSKLENEYVAGFVRNTSGHEKKFMAE